MSKIIVDPLTRISGTLGIEVEIKNNKIIDAKVTGNQFRGFELMFKNRDPFDIIRLAPRICGICSTHHALAATLAIENSMNIDPDFNGKVVRDIANAFEFLQNHIRHIYFFVIPDYVKMLKVNPLYKAKDEQYEDYRLNENDTIVINEHYLDAIKYSREAHKAIGVLAGKAPHCHGIWVGGVTTNIDIQRYEYIKYSVSVIKAFIEEKIIPDVQLIAKSYNDYFLKGKGHGNLMTYGIFDEYSEPIKYSTPKVRINNIDNSLELKNITEHINSTWIEGNSAELIPGTNVYIKGNPLKKEAYSWINAPRYSGNPMEVGALARMTLAKEYTKGISVMDRIVAKSFEAKKMCNIIEGLISLLNLKNAFQKEWIIPKKSEGIGIIEAERGSLGHWISINDSKIYNYTVITPSAWNLSPMDNNGVKGTVEQALIGMEVENTLSPVEIGRVVRSFDPCSNCAAHVVSDKYKQLYIKIV